MDDNKSLVSVDLQPVADVANNFMNKISSAIGWVFTRNTAEKISLDVYIDEIKKMDIPPLEKASLIYNAKKDIKEYSNQTSIVSKSFVYLNNNAQPKKMEDDWLVKFMDKCRTVSDKEFQTLWAMVLARECNVPGSIPIRVLAVLDYMDRKEAESFTNICRTVITFGNDCTPFIDRSRLGEYISYDITFESLMNLEALGLIATSLGPFNAPYSLSGDGLSIPVLRYFDHEYCIPRKDRGNYSVVIGNVVFTRAGEALYKALTVDEIEGFWDKLCLPYLIKNNH